MHRRIAIIFNKFKYLTGLSILTLGLGMQLASVSWAISQEDSQFYDEMKEAKLLASQENGECKLFIETQSGKYHVYLHQGRVYSAKPPQMNSVWAPPEIEAKVQNYYREWKSKNPSTFPPIAESVLKRADAQQGGTTTVGGTGNNNGNHGGYTGGTHTEPDPIPKDALFHKTELLFQEKGKIPQRHDISGLATDEKDFYRYLVLTQRCASASNPKSDPPLYVNLYLFSHGQGTDQQNFVYLSPGKSTEADRAMRLEQAFDQKQLLQRNEEANALLLTENNQSESQCKEKLFYVPQNQLLVKTIESKNAPGNLDFIVKYTHKRHINTSQPFKDETGDDTYYCSTVRDEPISLSQKTRSTF